MSSIQESNLLMEKRSFFMRSGSFEKLKCSAKYPFRVVGVKLSKVSLIELVESIIGRSRLLSQKLLLVLFIIIYKTICSLLSILVRTSANPLSVVGVCDKNNKDTTLGFYERLQQKVEKLQKHKKRLDSLKSSSDGIFSPTKNYYQTSSADLSKSIQLKQQQQQQSQPQQLHQQQQECSSIILEKKIITESPIILLNKNKINGDNNEKTVCDNDKANEFHAELKNLRQYSTDNLLKLKKNNIKNDTNIKRNFIESICLYPLVYGSQLFMLYQLYILGNIINSTPITLGFIFLIGSLGFIGFITFKVFLIEKFRKLKITPNKKNSSELRITDEQKIITINNNSNTIEDKNNETDSSDSNISKRQSRQRLKRNIDLSSKTLSKIKLL